MTAFLVLGALLVAGALLFIVPALVSRPPKTTVAASSVNAAVYRDQLRELHSDVGSRVLSPEDYEAARRELEARLLHDVPAGEAAPPKPVGRRTGAMAATATVPVLATVLYLLVGTPQALSPDAASPHGPAHAMGDSQIATMIERLAARMAKSPDDVDGWIMLARSYSVVGRFADASSAYARAVALVPGDARLLADYADALAMAQGQKLEGEPEKLVARALAIDPASVALPANGVRGVIRLAPHLTAKVAPADTVFVYARAAGGPRVPLAVMRASARDLPLDFKLDDAMAMDPNFKLSGFAEVVVSARISKSGNAQPQPGDLYGETQPIGNSASALAVVIDSETR